MEALANLFGLGPHWPCNLLSNVKVTSSQLSDRCVVYERPPTLQVGGYEIHFLLHLVNFLSSLLTPTSSGLILKMNRCYKGVSRELEKFMW
jgi:hypothetical protein